MQGRPQDGMRTEPSRADKTARRAWSLVLVRGISGFEWGGGTSGRYRYRQYQEGPFRRRRSGVYYREVGEARKNARLEALIEMSDQHSDPCPIPQPRLSEADRVQSSSAPAPHPEAREPARGYVVNRTDLEQRYASMSDSELRGLWSSDLTDAARGCLDQELIRRGVAPAVVERIWVDLASVVTLNANTRLIAEYSKASLSLVVLAVLFVVIGAKASSWVFVALGLIIDVVAIAYYAKAKGRSAAWCLCGLATVPGATLPGWIIVARLKTPPRFRCSGCGQVQSSGTRSCWGCGKAIVDLAVEPVKGQQTAESFRCPLCKTPVQLNAKKCPECSGLLKAGA